LIGAIREPPLSNNSRAERAPGDGDVRPNGENAAPRSLMSGFSLL
jgi:hypothetical protein